MSHIAFIGAGRMASAMVQGLLVHRIVAPHEISCTCGPDSTGPELARLTGIRFEREAADCVRGADLVVLACKPQQFSELSAATAEAAQGAVIVSILAGTPLERLSAKFSAARAVVRAMPNTPGQIGAGITAFCADRVLAEDDRSKVHRVLGSLGEVIEIGEDHLNAVTALSGSGPAYIFEFTAALRDAGISVGLPPEVALKLALHTVKGSARLQLQSREPLEQLRAAVTSKGGTTEAALKVFEAGDLRGLVARAVTAARDRGADLAKL